MKKKNVTKKLSLNLIKISQLSQLHGGIRNQRLATESPCQPGGPSVSECSVVCPTNICPSKFNKCDGFEVQ